MPKVLITGINGFTGRYLATELSKAGFEVHGLSHKPLASEIVGTTCYACDLNDYEGLASIVNNVQPDCVAHLAAISFVQHGDVEAIYRTNVLGSRSLLEALAKAGKPLRAVLLASSANVYGNALGGTLDELTQPNPANDYGVSKLSMEFVARLYSERLPIIITRPFNYTGVGQALNFLLPKIVDHVQRRAPVIELGNLDVARDFSDVRTTVQYYRRLLDTPSAVGKTFNICSGRAYTLQWVLDQVRSISGHDFEVRVNPAFVRASEVKRLVGSPDHLLNEVGAVTDIPLEETLRWMVEATL